MFGGFPLQFITMGHSCTLCDPNFLGISDGVESGGRMRPQAKSGLGWHVS